MRQHEQAMVLVIDSLAYRLEYPRAGPEANFCPTNGINESMSTLFQHYFDVIPEDLTAAVGYPCITGVLVLVLGRL